MASRGGYPFAGFPIFLPNHWGGHRKIGLPRAISSETGGLTEPKLGDDTRLGWMISIRRDAAFGASEKWAVLVQNRLGSGSHAPDQQQQRGVAAVQTRDQRNRHADLKGAVVIFQMD